MKVRLSEHLTYKKLFHAVLPTTMMMLFTSIYGVVDGIFVSNFVSTEGFAGLNLIWPVVMIVGSIGFMLGAGGSALAAKKLGEGEPERANKIFSMIVYFTTIIGIIISAVVFACLKPIARGLGSVGGKVTSQEMIDSAVLYGRILIGFNVTFMLQNLFQSFFVVAEKPMLGFIVTIAAGITNMTLDAIFIAGCGWGLVGAAVATGISQSVGTIIPIVYFSKKNSSLLRLTATKFEIRVLIKSCTNGSSELLSNIAMSVVSILFNLQLQKYAGANGVAAYGIIMYAGFVFCALFFGYIIGVAPMVGYNFGAQNHGELKNILKKSLIVTSVLSVLMVGSTEALAGVLSSIFSHGDAELLALTTHGFRLYGFSFGLCGFCIFSSGFFTALNDGLTSAFISFARTLVFQIACVLILPIWLGLDGVWLSIVLAEGLSVAVSAICIVVKRKKYLYF